MKSQNLERLNANERDVLATLMLMQHSLWPQSYMVEVRLDEPMKHLLDGGDGLHRHGGNGSRCYAHHYGDPDWAIVHIEDEDVQDWDWATMAARGAEYARERMEPEQVT